MFICETNKVIIEQRVNLINKLINNEYLIATELRSSSGQTARNKMPKILSNI